MNSDSIVCIQVTGVVARLLFGCGVDALPASVSVRKISTGHEHFSPRVEVPDGIVTITVGSTFDLFTEDVKVLVD